MELLISKNPMLQGFKYNAIEDRISEFLETATCLNIATGFISNESLAELRKLLEYRNQTLGLSLFIGMHYIDGFTRLQYQAARELHNYLQERSLGGVYVSPYTLFHGKMYSFMHDSSCLGAFVGSSNLASFLGTNQSHTEVDILLDDNEGLLINDKIIKITSFLGKRITEAEELHSFRDPETNLLDGVEEVMHLDESELIHLLSSRTGIQIVSELKSAPKSNLNTFFGAGKIKGRFSRRSYYEVELILSKRTPNIEYLPTKEDGPFWVVTEDGYKFQCQRQGDYGKNFRSLHDLKILGKWIKGQMESSGSLQIGEMVTEEVLVRFGKRTWVLEQTSDPSLWILSLK